MMDTNIKDRWLKALKSGEYKQGTHHLHYEDSSGNQRYCPLGVLCEVLERHISARTLPVCGFYYSQLRDVLAEQDQANLISLNDRANNYKPSIKYIEENL